MHCRFVLFPADQGLGQCILTVVDRQMFRSREDCPEICPFCSLGFFLPFSEIVVARLCSVNVASIDTLCGKAQYLEIAQLVAPVVSIESEESEGTLQTGMPPWHCREVFLQRG